jgi:hypothetical protein
MFIGITFSCQVFYLMRLSSSGVGGLKSFVVVWLIDE